MTNLEKLTNRLTTFRDDRDWKQFHSLKNLILSVGLEANELLALTQWKTDDAIENSISNPEFSQRLQDECADVLLYLLLIAERAGFDLSKAADNKINVNEKKYPVELSRGTAKKYNEL